VGGRLVNFSAGTKYVFCPLPAAKFNHDELPGYVAAEHIDWSDTGAEDIHDDRITASSVTQHEGSY